MDAKDIAAQELEFEQLIRDGLVTPSGIPTAMSDGVIVPDPVRCKATRSDGRDCLWPPIDRTGFCTVHVGRAHHQWRSRAADASLSTSMSLNELAERGSTELVKLVTWSVVLLHLERRGVDMARIKDRSRGVPARSYDQADSRKLAEVDAATAKLEMIIAQDLKFTPLDRFDKLPAMASRAATDMLRGIEFAQSPFGAAFRRYVDGVTSWDDWKVEVITELANRTAAIYLEAIYRGALHFELGWEPDPGSDLDSIKRARRAIDLLQRITSYNRRGPKAESREEARQRVQEAVDRVREQGGRLGRHSIAAELAVSPSGLDDLMRRHNLRRTKGGRVELSANN